MWKCRLDNGLMTVQIAELAPCPGEPQAAQLGMSTNRRSRVQALKIAFPQGLTRSHAGQMDKTLQAL